MKLSPAVFKPNLVALLWLLRALALVLLGLASGCVTTTTNGRANAPPAKAPFAGEALAPAPVMLGNETVSGGTAVGQEQASIPVSAADPSWGNAGAPVTIVEFSDFQCPFCSRVLPTLTQVQRTYGPERVRIVWKHNPLPFHAQARPTHDAAATVFTLGGSVAFFRFHDAAFGHQGQLTPENFATWAANAGVDRAAFQRAVASKEHTAKVDEDMALAKRVGANGTPAFRINGVTISGAQPFDKFKEVIDSELGAAEKLREQGTAPEQIYALRTNQNFKTPAAPSGEARDAEDEDAAPKVWKVPVFADDPVRGPADALVTIVEWSDFQCPFCKRVEDTVVELVKKYGSDVRVVWKDNPLPFHPRALPAAIFGRVAFKRGNDAFWRVHAALFEHQPKLEDQDFEAIAKEQGIPWAQVKTELDRANGPLRARIEASQDLANDLQARGTPAFFINGVLVSGAQPLEVFSKAIDAALEAARALVAHGVPRAKVYQKLQEDAVGPPPPETKEVAPPQANSPSKGPANAKVVIQIFSEFQCPFCKRVEPTLKELEQTFPGQLRFVWRHMPLPFHKDAKPAAEASEEVREQKGNGAFWKYHDQLFEQQGQEGALASENLTKVAVGLGVDGARFQAALDSHKHQPRVDADAKAAQDAGINGTPAFVINGYFVSGAQPFAVFKKLIKRALADTNRPAAKSAVKP